jgi:hypothetical protein
VMPDAWLKKQMGKLLLASVRNFRAHCCAELMPPPNRCDCDDANE